MKLTVKKSECKKDGTSLLVTSKKEAHKKLISTSKIQYCITVEPFPMSYAYSEKMSEGEKFICDMFSIN